MAATGSVLRHAPYLRRYARALTGSQSEGDGFVRATLESLIGSEQKLAGVLPVRVALFRAFHVTWRSSLNVVVDRLTQPRRQPGGHAAAAHDARAPHRHPADPDGGSAPQRRPRSSRCPRSRFSAGFEAAQRSIEKQLATNVLIIEDETLIAQGLESLVSEMGHRVTGVAATKDQALALAERRAPGLVLADVRLADGSSGIEAAGDIQKVVDVPVIFITAFPERLLTGERPEPVFLGLQAVQRRRPKALIGQALFFHQPRPKMALA